METIQETNTNIEVKTMKTTQETNINSFKIEVISDIVFAAITIIIGVGIITFILSTCLQQNKITLIVNNIAEFEIYKTHLIGIVDLTHLTLTFLTILVFFKFLLNTRSNNIFYFLVLGLLFIMNNSNTNLSIENQEIQEGVFCQAPKFLAYSLKFYNEIK